MIGSPKANAYRIDGLLAPYGETARPNAARIVPIGSMPSALRRFRTDLPSLSLTDTSSRPARNRCAMWKPSAR